MALPTLERVFPPHLTTRAVINSWKLHWPSRGQAERGQTELIVYIAQSETLFDQENLNVDQLELRQQTKSFISFGSASSAMPK